MKQIISTPKAPQAIGPYSQAIKSGNLIFCAAQIAMKPDGTMVEGGITEETKQVMENIKAVLEEASSSLEKIVKTTIYLQDINDFQTVNEIYGSYFPNNPPARATVEVAALPKGAKVEIEAIAEV